MPEELKVTSNRGRSRTPQAAPVTQTQEVPEVKKPRVEHDLQMGLGDAVLRLIHVELTYSNIPDPGPQVVAERKLLVEALNQKFQLNLGMDCDENGIPDSIEDSVSVFAHSAKTSCCRISKESPPKKEEEGEETPVTPKGRGFFATLFGTK